MQRSEEMARKLETVQTKEVLNTIYAVDEKGVGGANHKYTILHAKENEEVPANLTTITFQTGARRDPDSISGVLDPDLLEIVRDRLKGFQEGDFATDDNAKALEHVEKALHYMNQRVEKRIERNVLGTLS